MAFTCKTATKPPQMVFLSLPKQHRILIGYQLRPPWLHCKDFAILDHQI
ncbi:hypothetical protein [Lyngbya aestuarii]